MKKINQMLYVNNEHTENKRKTTILIISTWKEVKSYQNMYRMYMLKVTKMFMKEFKT